MRSTPALIAYSLLGGACLLAALALHRPELVAVGTPALVVSGLALAGARPTGLRVSARLEQTRSVEGEEVTVDVDLVAAVDVARVEVTLMSSPALLSADGRDTVAVALRAGVVEHLQRRLRCSRYGAHRLGEVQVRAHDRLSLVVADVVVPLGTVLRVYPAVEPLIEALRPRWTQLRTGNRTSRASGDGIEFTDVRPFEPGDRVRHVNWRLSARTGALHVNVRHPERNADVVVLVDTFSDVAGAQTSSLELAVRAAGSVASHFLAERDRVAVVGFGGVLRWLLPGMGRLQLQRIVDALLDSAVSLHYAWKDIDLLPPRLLPPRAMVVAISPLLDERTLSAIVDLRGRGYDVAVLEVSPLSLVPPRDDEEGRLAHRLLRLRREALRQRLRSRGIGVAEWRVEEPVAQALEEVARFRRYVTSRRG